jgi:uncharacterized protein (TIGR02453 family)
MDSKLILAFLRDVMRNNNREWFQAHRTAYDEARAEFEQGIAKAIGRIADFDEEIAHVSVKDATYRFYRDTRFSLDKSPYKNHFGAYINAHGKKALRGGYYIHLEPGNCLLAVGNYWLPTNVLTACRNEMMSNTEQWLKCVNRKDFKKYFLSDPAAQNPFWGDTQGNGSSGFGLERLKTCPAGFSKDWKYVEWLRLKDYCAWRGVQEDFFIGDGWLDEMTKIFKAAKPMMDFVNAVIDDYE